MLCSLGFINGWLHGLLPFGKLPDASRVITVIFFHYYCYCYCYCYVIFFPFVVSFGPRFSDALQLRFPIISFSPLFPSFLSNDFSSFLRSSHFDDVPYGSLSSLGWGLQFVLLLPRHRFLHQPSHRLGSTVCLLCVVCLWYPRCLRSWVFCSFFFSWFLSLFLYFTIIVISFICLVKA